MKRRLFVGVFVLILILVCAALNTTITDPADCSGVWYRGEDAARCVFRDGIIECADQERIVFEDAVFSGAYSFAKDKAVVFVVDANGVSEVMDLYLVHGSVGDILCETKDGTGKIWFYRDQEAARGK